MPGLVSIAVSSSRALSLLLIMLCPGHKADEVYGITWFVAVLIVTVKRAAALLPRRE